MVSFLFELPALDSPHDLLLDDQDIFGYEDNVKGDALVSHIIGLGGSGVGCAGQGEGVVDKATLANERSGAPHEPVAQVADKQVEGYAFGPSVSVLVGTDKEFTNVAAAIVPLCLSTRHHSMLCPRCSAVEHEIPG